MNIRGKVFSFINYKGGVGKTTLAVEVSAAIANKLNAKALLIDTDPQTNATLYLMKEDEWNQWQSNKGTLREVFQRFLDGQVPDPRPFIVTFNHSLMKNLSLLPSHIDLLPMDLKLAACYGAESTTGIKLFKTMIDRFLRPDYALLFVIALLT